MSDQNLETPNDDTTPPAESVNPPADPGNSPPSEWTAPLDPQEEQEVKDQLEANAAETAAANEEASEAGRAQADFEVVDGAVVPVEKAATYQESLEARGTEVYGLPDKSVEFVEPAPVEYRTDEQVAKDDEPTEEATADGGSSV